MACELRIPSNKRASLDAAIAFSLYSGRHRCRASEPGRYGKTEFMKRIGFFFILALAGGCATSSMPSAQRQFRKEHPGAEVLAQTANDATEHTGYWPHSTTRRYAAYTFRYREADGVEHEEVWHYKYLNHGWSVEKEQTR